MSVRKCGGCGEPGHNKRTCPTGGQVPDQFESPGDVTTVGPVFEARFPGICEGTCGGSFEEGEPIRADGSGGYLHDECADDVVIETRAPKHWERPTAANVGKVLAETAQSINAFTDALTAPVVLQNAGGETVIDEFLSPVAVSDPEPGNGPKTERLGYVCKDPSLGDFRRYKNGNKKGITRTTTFVKAASDTYAIAQWNKRNVLLGAARRPDIAARAHGMDVNEDKAQLDRWVEELEDVAGGNVASNMGTDVHLWTERVDAGECTVADVPPTYRPHVERYVKALREAGLVVVPELRERTTFVEEYGGVAGTFDAILFHEPTGTYVLSDTKSGKNVGKYGWSEIEAQEWVYAHGYNKFGTYNWETQEWESPQHQVRMDYGLVIHMPFEGDHANTCRLLRTNLVEGASYAALCGSVREHPKGKPTVWSLPAVQRDWDAEFAAVQNKEQGASLWSQAKAAGLPLQKIADLVTVAQSALRRKN